MKDLPIIPFSEQDFLEKIKMAVLKVMHMNNRLYNILHSTIFDVPDYEKENILYNLETLDLQHEQYLFVDFKNPDLKFHQSQLDIQILCNRRIRQNVREAREMYADRHNPLYSRKKFITAKVFPNAAKHLPKTLHMTFLCDHLLNVYHYMYDPLIKEVMDCLVAEQNQSAIPLGLPQHDIQPADLTGGFNPVLEANNFVTEDKITLIELPRAFELVEIPEISEPVKQYTLEPAEQLEPESAEKLLPQSVEQPEPESAEKHRPQSAEQSKPESAEKPKPKPVEKPRVICDTDLVGQILLQGLQSNEATIQPCKFEISFNSCIRNTNSDPNLLKAAESEISSVTSAVGVKKENTMTNTKIRPPASKVGWNMKKLLDTKPVSKGITKKEVTVPKVIEKQKGHFQPTEKRLKDILAETVREEMEAKKQRMTQWLQGCVSNTVGIKRKASLMDKSRKDKDAKRRKMTNFKAKPKSTDAQPIKMTLKKSNINWVIK